MFGGLAPAVFLMATPAAPGEIRGAASPSTPGNPMVRDIVSRLEQSARAEPDPARRRAVLRDSAQSLPRALYPGILGALVPPAPDSIDGEIARAVFLRWVWETPDFAAHWAARSPPGPFRMEALAEAAGRWRARNPNDALRWAEGLSLQDRQWIDANEGRFSVRGDADVATPKRTGG